MLTKQAQKTLDSLRAKVEDSDKRFPSIQSIHKLLNELSIEHYFDGETQNTVEYRSQGNRYVNSRHDGKKGKKIKLRAYTLDEKDICLGRYYDKSPMNSDFLEMDSSDSYHSYNTFGYALKLVHFIDNQDRLRFERD